MMTELDEPFNGVDRDFKSYVEKLLPRRNVLPWKTTYPWYMMLYGHINN